MAKNDFKAFAVDANANVLSQVDYENLDALISGFHSGIARSEQLNKVWRQASVVAAMLGEFIATQAGDDVVDNGDLNQLLVSWLKALLNYSEKTLDSRYLNVDKNLSDVQNKNAACTNIGAVAKSGDTMTGKLTLPQTSSFGVNTTNALGGSSIAIGDSDTGLRQNGDGVLDVYANNQQVFRFEPNSVTNFREQAYYPPGAPVGSGAFADQLTNATAPFVQKSWNWTPGNGGHFVPLVKGLSNRTNIGYPSAVSFGYLLTDDNGFAIPAIHVRGDNSFDASWQFNPNDKTLYCPGNVYAGGATYQDDGNISGSVWGGYLSEWLKNNKADLNYVNNDNTPTTNAANRGAIDARIEWWCQARNPGDVGSYAMLTTTEDNVRPGSIRGGLHYADGADQAWGDAPGNWRLMGNISGIGSSGGSVSIWLRIY